MPTQAGSITGTVHRSNASSGGGAPQLPSHAAPGKKASSTVSKKASQTVDWTRVILGCITTLLWMFTSSALIILNKNLYRMGFSHPCFVTGMGQVFSALGGYGMVKAGLAPLRPSPSLHFWATRLMPIVASTAATMFFGNAAYLTLSVAFIQILKAFTPALTLLLCVLAGLEKAQWPLLVSVLLIAGGTAGAVVVESGAASFHLGGFLYFMASSITEAARVVGAEVLLGGTKRYNSAEALLYIGGPTSVVLLVASYIWEGADIIGDPARGIPGTGRLLLENPGAFVIAFVMSFLVNLTCFFAIQYTSSLTFKVAGCVKNVAVVWYGIVAHGEVVTALQVLGYSVSVVGFAMYSKLKMSVAERRQQKKAAGRVKAS